MSKGKKIWHDLGANLGLYRIVFSVFTCCEFQVICSLIIEFHNSAHCSLCHLWFVLLPGRFRQIEVLTTVANAFSSLYSQVSGTPLQKIGSMNSTASSKEASSPPPLMRSNTANRLMKTLSKLNLCGNSQAGEGGSPTTLSPAEKAKTEDGIEEAEAKNELKTPKHFKASPLATVKEEVPSNPFGVGLELSDGTEVEQGTPGSLGAPENKEEGSSRSRSDSLCDKAAAITSPGLESKGPESTGCEPGGDPELQSPPASILDKEPLAPIANPSIASLMLQQKDSFEMEEVSVCGGGCFQCGQSLLELSAQMSETAS